MMGRREVLSRIATIDLERELEYRTNNHVCDGGDYLEYPSNRGDVHEVRWLVIAIVDECAREYGYGRDGYIRDAEHKGKGLWSIIIVIPSIDQKYTVEAVIDRWADDGDARFEHIKEKVSEFFLRVKSEAICSALLQIGNEDLEIDVAVIKNLGTATAGNSTYVHSSNTPSNIPPVEV